MSKILYRRKFSLVLSIYPRVELLGVHSFEELPKGFPKWLYQFTYALAVYEGSSYATYSPTGYNSKSVSCPSKGRKMDKWSTQDTDQNKDHNYDEASSCLLMRVLQAFQSHIVPFFPALSKARVLSVLLLRKQRLREMRCFAQSCAITRGTLGASCGLEEADVARS